MERIFAEAAKSGPKKASDDGQAVSRQSPGSGGSTGTESLPKGVVLGPDGKPCRTCTSTAQWAAMVRARRSKEQQQQQSSPTSSRSSTTSSSPASAATAASTTTAALAPSSSSSPPAADASAPFVLPADCPPDVERLGRHTWTLLHGMAAAYPERASAAHQADMRGFLALFARLYPCWSCAADFREWMARPGNAPRLDTRDRFGRWLCDAHNDVNRKLGKREFDCDLWRERWVDGWKDGRCDP